MAEAAKMAEEEGSSDTTGAVSQNKRGGAATTTAPPHPTRKQARTMKPTKLADCQSATAGAAVVSVL